MGGIVKSSDSSRLNLICRRNNFHLANLQLDLFPENHHSLCCRKFTGNEWQVKPRLPCLQIENKNERLVSASSPTESYAAKCFRYIWTKYSRYVCLRGSFSQMYIMGRLHELIQCTFSAPISGLYELCRPVLALKTGPF